MQISLTIKLRNKSFSWSLLSVFVIASKKIKIKNSSILFPPFFSGLLFLQLITKVIMYCAVFIGPQTIFACCNWCAFPCSNALTVPSYDCITYAELGAELALSFSLWVPQWQLAISIANRWLTATGNTTLIDKDENFCFYSWLSFISWFMNLPDVQRFEPVWLMSVTKLNSSLLFCSLLRII